MTTTGKRPLRLVEIQESVLPEDEWIIGISALDYFNGVGYSMPRSQRIEQKPGVDRDSSLRRRLNLDVIAYSKLEDQLETGQGEGEVDDALLASSESKENEASNDKPHGSIPLDSLLDGQDSMNLYAFIPGIFYCSGQETSVDAILIEVTQNERFGMTLSSFRPEDVRSLDISKGFMLDETGKGKSVQITVDTLGSFHSEDFLKDSGLTVEEMSYSKEIELARRLSGHMPLSELRRAYASSSFLQARLMKLLEDIDFFGLAPRRRIYVRNEKHPYGRVVEVDYRLLNRALYLRGESGVSCPDETELESQLNCLVFTKLMGAGTETTVEEAIIEMLHFIKTGLKKRTSKEEVLDRLSQEGD